MFIGEHINPFKTFREVTARRRIQSGRKAAIIALPICFACVFGAQFLLEKFKTDEPLIAFRLPDSEDYIADEPLAGAIATEADVGLTDAELLAGAGVVSGADADADAEKITNIQTNSLEAKQDKATAVIVDSPTVDSLTDEIKAWSNLIQVAAVDTFKLNTEKESIQVNIPPVKELALANNSEESRLLKATQWIGSQTPRSYTIQVNASSDKASVELFLAQSELPEPNAIFPFERNGKTWYALVHGVYSSSNRAEAAIKQLPKPAQFHSPWVRRFGKLQEILISPN